MSYRLPGLYRTKFMWICLRHCRCPMCRSLSLLALRVSWQTGLPLFFYSSLDEDWSVWNTAAAFLKKKKDFYLYAYKRVRKWNQDRLKLHVAKRIVRPSDNEKWKTKISKPSYTAALTTRTLYQIWDIIMTSEYFGWILGWNVELTEKI